MTRLALVAALLVAASSSAPSPLALPGGEGGIGFDDLRFSPDLHRILVPAGRTGRLDLVDLDARTVESIEGFSQSASRERGHGEGTTSADAGGGFVFAIDRTARTLVVVDPRARRVVARTRLDGAPDYVRWVAPAHEVWVTEPAREAIEVFRFQAGASPPLTRTGNIRVPAGPCDEGKAVALDAEHGGRPVGTAKTGEGVDSIAYSPQLSHLYVPAADAATLSVIGVESDGRLEPLGTLPTAPDAHCAAADEQSNVYVCDPRNGRLLVGRDPYPPSQ